MTLLKEFSYSNINQRRLVLVNIFMASLTISFVLSDLAYSMKYYFFYFPVLSLLFLLVLFGIFCGNLLGRFFFSKIRCHRPVLIATDIIFVLLSSGYLSRFYLLPGTQEPLFLLFDWSVYAIPAFCFLLCLFHGMKLSYTLKVVSGNYIDEKNSILSFITLSMAGVFLGIALASTSLFNWFGLGHGVISLSMVFFPAALAGTALFVNLAFNPRPMFAQHFDYEAGDEQEQVAHRDDLYFTYLNFSYILIYLYLAYESYIKFYGDIFNHKVAFMAAVTAAVALGFASGKVIRSAFWHIYSEMLFPLFFLVFLFLIYDLNTAMSFRWALCFIVPMSLLFGFAVFQTINAIIVRFDHVRRFNILDFALFILPAPILGLLSLVEFSYRWFFIFAYVIMLVNIIIPGVYFLNRNARNYRRIIFFTLSMVFIPLMVFMHLYFRIPLSGAPYVERVKNFNEVKSTNYDALYIKNRADVTINGTIAYRLSDSIVRNMKRAFIPVYLHHPLNERILVIDGNQKFFRHPVIDYFRDAVCLDPVSAKFVDGQSLPAGGIRRYVSDEDCILKYLNGSDVRYHTIVDNPNLMDVQQNPFRFSIEYYEYVKRHMTEGGVFVTIFNVNLCGEKALSRAMGNLKSLYRHHLVYLFSGMLVVLSSDNDRSFEFNSSLYQKLSELFQQKKDLPNLFYSETHFFSHLLFTDITALLPFINVTEGSAPRRLIRSSPLKVCVNWQDLSKAFLSRNDRVMELYRQDNPDYSFRLSMANSIMRDSAILALLKQTELAETEERYTDEMTYLFQLNKLADYNPQLKPYVKTILSYKEEYYYNAALMLEKKKDWEGAKKLYLALLAINRDNFEANYRLGLLSLTLQELEASFKYLQNALALKKDHPKALYQMGVLLLSSGRPEEAISYLNQALEARERNSQVFFYLGLAYEKMGNLQEAKNSYDKALIEDPNDVTIQSRLQNVNSRLGAEKEKWKAADPGSLQNEFESEKGEDLPLPINKSAYDVRLKDSDKDLPDVTNETRPQQ